MEEPNKLVKVIDEGVNVVEKVGTVHEVSVWNLVSGVSTLATIVLSLGHHWIASAAGVLITGAGYFLGKRSKKTIRW